MKGKKFNWDDIVKDSTKIISKSILKGNDEITTLKTLYTALEITYQKKGKEIPTYSTYRQKMHKILHIKHNQKNVKNELYQLAGKYEKMTLDVLAENICLSSQAAANKCNWLFIRLKRYESDYIKTQKHLYFLSQKLKEKFKNEIIFISFDTDTIVVMCSNSNAKIAVHSYLNSISNAIAVDSEEGN